MTLSQQAIEATRRAGDGFGADQTLLEQALTAHKLAAGEVQSGDLAANPWTGELVPAPKLHADYIAYYQKILSARATIQPLGEALGDPRLPIPIGPYKRFRKRVR